MFAPSKLQVLDAILRSDFSAFVEKCFTELNSGTPYRRNWHIEAIACQLERCMRGENKRLIITVPPRSLKSLCASVAFPAFLLGHSPHQRLINLSYSQELGTKLSAGFRQVVKTDWYKRIFPAMGAARDTEAEFETTRGGGRAAISIGSSLTGRGANFIVIDDPMKADEASSRSARDRVNDYYKTTLFSRLDDKQLGVIILVMQRLHEDDLAGQLLKQPGWFHLNLPAIATTKQEIQLSPTRWRIRKEGDVLHPEREPRHVLDRIRHEIGTIPFEAQYQQAPIPTTGNIIRRDWLRYHNIEPSSQSGSGTYLVQSWDTAMKGEQIHDFSVCSTWLKKDGNHYLIDLVRQRCEYPKLLHLVLALHKRYKPDTVLIEDHGVGTALIQALRSNHQIRSIPIKPESDKETRLATASIYFEQGSVYFPKKAEWLVELENELLRFPQVQFDDQVDSVSQYLNWDRVRVKPKFEWEWMY